MTPSPLIATYTQYTADSDAVAAWLAKTATICGYPRDLRTRQVDTEQKVKQKAEQKSGRLKGKARKLAQQASSKNPSDSENRGTKPNVVPELPKYLVSREDLVPLAEWIANSAHTCIEVPASLVFVLNRAIRVREAHFIWWCCKMEEPDNNIQTRENHNYDYFTGVLENVREILRLMMPTELLKNPLVQFVEPTSTSSGSKKSEINHMANCFEGLDLEEPFETSLNAEPITAGQQPSSTLQVEYCLDRVQDIGETHFAFHCLALDFHVIRTYLQKVWESYKLGETDLVAASITTNTAIDHARGLQEDFTEAFPKNYGSYMHFYTLYYVTSLNAKHDPVSRNRHDDEMNFEAYEDIEPKLFPTFLILSFFNDYLKLVKSHTYTGRFGWYEPKSYREWMAPKWKFREDKALLLQVLPDFCILAHGQGEIPVVDGMTRAIHEMTKQDDVIPWLVLAAQVYLDIHHILRQKVSDGFNDLIKSAKYIEKNVQQILGFQMNVRPDNWPKSNNDMLFRILDVIKTWVNLDEVQEARIRMHERVGVEESPAESFYFLKNHPWYCGLLLYHIKASAREASIAFVNSLGSILSSAQLYNVLRQEGLMTNVWPDMDLALLMHRTEGLFIGGFPKTTADYSEQFSLAMKHSAKNPGKDSISTVVAKSGPRRLSQLSPICEIFKDRFCGCKPHSDLSPHDMKTILDVAESVEVWKIPKVRIQINESPRIRFLNGLLNVLQSETLELTFDHFRLHIFCWALLRTLREALREDIVELYGRGCLDKNRDKDKEHELSRIVGYILNADTDKQELTRKRKLASTLEAENGQVLTKNPLLAKAAKVMDQMFETGVEQSQLGMLKELGVHMPASMLASGDV